MRINSCQYTYLTKRLPTRSCSTFFFNYNNIPSDCGIPKSTSNELEVYFLTFVVHVWGLLNCLPLPCILPHRWTCVYLVWSWASLVV